MKVTRAELAKKLQVSRQRVHSMVQEGLIVPDSKGLIDLDTAITTIAANRDPARGGKRTPIEADESFSEARTRKETALANLREIEAAEKRGELVNAREYNDLHILMIVAAKTRLRSIPITVAGEVAHLGKTLNGRAAMSAISKLLLTAIDSALLELSQWKPEEANEKKTDSR